MKLYPRYERHTELPGLGEEGQKKLFRARVAIIGLGGLGSPVALYLTAAGVGHITLFDDDNVSLINLQRQILFDVENIGKKKVECASKKLQGLNPETRIEASFERVNEDNVGSIISNHDLLLDCSDNFATRYLLNDAVAKTDKILVSGSVVFYDGQVAVFKKGYACYRCIYPIAPEAHQAPTCTESAVLGPVVGVIGTIMCVEAIKELTGIGETSAGKLTSYSGLTSRTETIFLSKDIACPACLGIPVHVSGSNASCVS